MARGRFISKQISDSLTFHNLPDDFTRLLWLMLIPHLDREGRFYGHPRLVRTKVMPWRTDITDEQVEDALHALESADFIRRYSGAGQEILFAPNFADFQQGLRKDREAPSIFPTESGATPDQLPAKDKGKGEGESEDQAEAEGNAAAAANFLDEIGIGAPAFHNLKHLDRSYLENLWAHCQDRTTPNNTPGLFVHLATSGFKPPPRPGSAEADRARRYKHAQGWTQHANAAGGGA